jgi:hypothetical protein
VPINDFHQEQLLELKNADFFFTNRCEQKKDTDSDFLTSVEINSFLTNSKIPESCV